MKPSVPAAARDLAERLRSEIAPELSGFNASAVAMTAQMIDMIGEAWDGVAARLVEENTATRALLTRDGAEYAFDGDLRISALEADNARLRSALIALHADVEQRDGDAAHALERDIWAELARSVERRRVASANF